MSNLGSLVVELSANVARFQSDMGKAAAIADQSMRRVQEASDAAARAVQGAFMGIAAGLSVHAFVEGIKGAIDMADHLNDLSKSTGIAVEVLGGIGFAASMAGADLDSTAKAIGKLNLKIADAAMGGKEASKLFDTMGVSVRDLSGQVKGGDVIFAELAKKFESYEDGPEKAALGNAAFGRSYQQIIPLLDDGAGALKENIEYYKRFGGVTTDVAKRADEFNDTLGKINLISSSFSRTLAAELLPSLQAVADELLRIKEGSTGTSIVITGLRTIFETVVVLGANVAFVLATIGRELKGVYDRADALAHMDFRRFSSISSAVASDSARARTELDAFEKRVLQVGEVTKKADGTPTKSKIRAPGLPTNDSKEKQPFAAFLEDLDRMIEKTNQGEYAMLRLKASQIAAKDPAANLGDALERINKIQGADSQKTLSEYIKKLDDEANAFAFQASIVEKSATEQTRLTFAAAKRQQAEEAVNAAVRAGRPLTEQASAQLRQQTEDTIRYTEVVRSKRDALLRSQSYGVTKALRDYTDTATDAAKNAETLITGSLNKVEDALIDFAKTGKLSLHDLFSYMAEEFLRQQIRMGTAKVINSGFDFSQLFKLGGSSFGGSGSVDYNALADESHHANGLSYVPYDGYRAVLHEGEKVTSKQENRAGSGGPSIDNSIGVVNVGQGVSRGETLAAIRQAQAETVAMIRRSMKQGTFG